MYNTSPSRERQLLAQLGIANMNTLNFKHPMKKLTNIE